MTGRDVVRVLAIMAIAVLAGFAQLIGCLFFRDGTTPWAGIWCVSALFIAGSAGFAVGRLNR